MWGGTRPTTPSPAEIMKAYDDELINWDSARALLMNIHGYTYQMVVDAIGYRPTSSSSNNQNGNGDTQQSGDHQPGSLPDNFFGFIMLMMGL